jgi:RnfABCDGE-type electron transport complex D subunit
MEEVNKIAPITLKNTYIYTIALGVLGLISTIIFGMHVLLLIAVAFLGALPFEFLFSKLRKKPLDYAWMVHPILLVLLLPPNAPWWMALIASAFGVVFGKLIFGGSGKYIFPPSLVGVLFAYISFPSFITAISWPIPLQNDNFILNFISSILGTSFQSTDLVTGATPLMNLNRGNELGYGLLPLLFGGAPGTLGETFRAGIILLGIVLLALKVFDWKIPLTYITTVFAVTGILHLIWPDTFRDPILSIFVGGLLFGAFFIAADPAIIPKHTASKIIYGVGLGLLTILIRTFSTFPEGVTFSIIIMSAISPLIDTFFMKEQGGSKA